jgi:predicted  nucleic acid-binding Zn-ribbon protein
MEIELLSGTFTIEEAEALITAILNTKIAFHKTKINTIQMSEEDIKHSEKKIAKLQQSLSDTIEKLRQNGQTHTSLNAHIEINTRPRLHQ